MNKKDKAMVISFGSKDGQHFHINNHLSFKEQLQEIIVTLDTIKRRQ